MGRAAGGKRGKPARPAMTKITIRLDADLATRLAVESAMRHVSMGDIVAEYLGPHLRRWRLPSNSDLTPAAEPAPASGTEEAA